MSRHKHYTPPADQPQMSFSDPDYMDKLNAALPSFAQEPPSVAIDTSEAAALAIQPKAGTLRSRVLSVIRGRGPRGATEREIEYVLRLPGNTVRPRLWELEGNVPAGRRPRTALIYKSEEKREGMRVYKAVHL